MRAKLPHTSGYVDRDGVKLYFEVYGKGDHTIFFVPTWSLVHSRIWKAQVPYFSEHFRCITLDPRGNGKSDTPDRASQFQLKDYVGDIIAVMDETGTGKATLVGVSMGAEVIAAAAVHHPDRVASLITIGASLPMLQPTYDYKTWDHYDGSYDTNDGWNKYSRDYWLTDYPDFAKFFMAQIFNDPHSTKQLEDGIRWSSPISGQSLVNTMEAPTEGDLELSEAHFRRIKCPVLAIHSENDIIAPIAASERLVGLTGGELARLEHGGHGPQGRYPARVNTLIRDFLACHFDTHKPRQNSRARRPKRALYLSSPIGLGHARRDLAVTRELRKLHPDLQVDWLAQDPVTRFLNANAERVHPASNLLANESAHIEAECGEHDLHAFQAIRNMDEILIKNFMVFQEVLEAEPYDLVIADEAWDVDHYWHEHPDLKKAPIAWLTDFVGWVPFKENGPREAFLTTDYNAEMIGHVEGNPTVRDRAIFVGGPEDIVDMSFGSGLPKMRDWIPRHYEFSDYIIGQHPAEFGSRDDLRAEFGYDDGRLTCIVAVGGSGVGATLIRRILEAYPMARALLPELRMIVVTGPRLDPSAFKVPAGVEMRAFVPNLDRHLAACDLALVQGGLTTCMELAAAGTPFLYFPLRNHFEQNFHVASRLERYNAGRKMIFAEAGPTQIAEAMLTELRNPRIPLPVARDGAARAASMLADLL
ncbi:MAG: alpha/beta fold hydrolase [Albidovulum sp.]